LKRMKRFVGVYYRESTKRRVDGKPDRCFYVLTKVSGELKYHRVGWISEGVSAQFAARKRVELLMTHRKDPGALTPAPDLTFLEAGEAYLKWAFSNKRSARDDAIRFRLHLAPRFGAKKLSNITSLHLEDMKRSLAETLAPATVKQCLALVRQIFNKAALWNLYKGANPVRRVNMPKTDNRRVRFLSEGEATLLLDELRKVSRNVHDMAYVALFTGLRAGEIINLTWQDINFDAGTIMVKDPKNSESRIAYLNKKLTELFLARRPEGWTAGDWVFPGKKGEKAPALSKTFFRVVYKLGLNENRSDPRDKVVFHTLRHTFASWLAIRGTPLLTIMELMGHKNIAMTMRYAHLIPDVKREALTKLPDLGESSTAAPL
jgi:integrase